MSRCRKAWSLALAGIFILLSIKLTAADQVKIKSLKVYNDNDETTVPILLFDDKIQDQLRIEFDVDYPYEPNLNLVFRFCNRNWHPTDNIFFSNFGQNTAFALDLERLPSTIEGASYHFRGSYPDKKGEVSFPYSGKWMLYITDSQDTSIVYASARFIVVRDPLKVTGSLKNETLEDKTYFPNDLAKVFNLTLSFQLPDELFPSNVAGIEIFENHKFDNPYTVDRNGNRLEKYYSWDGNRQFSFTSREIRPGNEYRQVDIRNINVFGAKDVYAHTDGVEVNHFFVRDGHDLNGGSLLTRYRDPNATYLNVTFRLRASLAYGKKVYLTGAFNNWKILPEYEMNNDNG
ncbi:MAG: type IX secretion system plug protein domain-containing protein, partial [Syntrophothermus sp.]